MYFKASIPKQVTTTFNGVISFYRILRILDMQQIGRNYYNPKDPLNVPQHKYIHFPHSCVKIFGCFLRCDPHRVSIISLLNKKLMAGMYVNTSKHKTF